MIEVSANADVSTELDPGADILQVPRTTDCGGRGGFHAGVGVFLIVWDG